MALTGVAVVGMLAVGLAVPSLHPALAGGVPDGLRDAFALSVGLMVAHKIESYAAREWEVCPVYRTLVHDAVQRPLGEVLFLTLIPAVLGAFVLIALLVRGGPWPLLVLGMWLGQGLHEWHHLGKSLARRRYYPGLVTGTLFAAHAAGAYAPAWLAAVGGAPTWGAAAFAGLALAALVAFYLEDRAWFPRWEAWRATQAG